MSRRDEVFRAALAAQASAPAPARRTFTPRNPILGPSFTIADSATVSRSGNGKKGGGGFNVLEGLLNILTTPQSVVTSTIKELGDAMSPSDGQDASFGDWFNQIYHPKDRVFGQDLLFGNAEKGVQGASWAKALPDNPWLRMPLGLAVDVATDPLTYMLPGSKLAMKGPEAVANEVLQSAGRQVAKEAEAAFAREFGEASVKAMQSKHGAAASGKMVEKLAETAAVVPDTTPIARSVQKIGELRAGAAEAVAEARRTGVHGLSQGQIEQFLTREGADPRLGQRGLRWAFTDKVVPGTDSAVMRRFGQAWGELKAKGADLSIGTIGKKTITDRDMLLAARSGDPSKAYAAVATTMAKDRMVASNAAAHAAAVNEFGQVVSKLSEEQKANLFRALESGSSPKTVAEIKRLFPKDEHAGLRDLLDRLIGDAQKAGLNVQRRIEYVPRSRLTEDGRALLSEWGMLSDGSNGDAIKSAFEQARTLKRGRWVQTDDVGQVVAENWDSAVSPGKNWTWADSQQGKYKFGGELFDAADQAEVRAQVNEIAKRRMEELNPELAAEMTDFFDPDVVKVIGSYISNVTRRTAEANAATELFNMGIGETSRRLMLNDARARKLVGLRDAIGRFHQRIAEKESRLAAGEAQADRAAADLLQQRHDMLVASLQGSPLTATSDLERAAAAMRTVQTAQERVDEITANMAAVQARLDSMAADRGAATASVQTQLDDLQAQLAAGPDGPALLQLQERADELLTEPELWLARYHTVMGEVAAGGRTDVVLPASWVMDGETMMPIGPWREVTPEVAWRQAPEVVAARKSLTANETILAGMRGRIRSEYGTADGFYAVVKDLLSVRNPYVSDDDVLEFLTVNMDELRIVDGQAVRLSSEQKDVLRRLHDDAKAKIQQERVRLDSELDAAVAHAQEVTRRGENGFAADTYVWSDDVEFSDPTRAGLPSEMPAEGGKKFGWGVRDPNLRLLPSDVTHPPIEDLPAGLVRAMDERFPGWQDVYTAEGGQLSLFGEPANAAWQAADGSTAGLLADGRFHLAYLVEDVNNYFGMPLVDGQVNDVADLFGRVKTAIESGAENGRSVDRSFGDYLDHLYDDLDVRGVFAAKSNRSVFLRPANELELVGAADFTAAHARRMWKQTLSERKRITDVLKGVERTEGQVARAEQKLAKVSAPAAAEGRAVKELERLEEAAVLAQGQVRVAEVMRSQTLDDIARRRALDMDELVRLRALQRSGTPLRVSPEFQHHVDVMLDELDTAAKWNRQAARGLKTADKKLTEIATLEETGARLRKEIADLQLGNPKAKGKYKRMGLYDTPESTGMTSQYDFILDSPRSPADPRWRVTGQDGKLWKEQISEAVRTRAQYELRHGIGTPAEIADVLRRFDKLELPKVLQHYQKVVGWIAAWQIATPGFHNRNMLGGMFNNALADVDLISYKEFLSARRAVLRQRAGKAVAGTVNPEHIDRYLRIEKLVGEGQIGALGHYGINDLEDVVQGGRVSKNPLSRRGPIIRTSQAWGGKTEHVLRGSLAWDVIKKGGSDFDALHSVNKFHFNYADLTKSEQAVRLAMPFYTWFRNDLPLQVEMLTRNPKVYARVAYTTRNVEAQSDPDAVVPDYFGKLAPMMRLPWMRAGGHVYLTPDLPMRDLQLLEPGGRFQLGTPLRTAASMVTPVVKTPVELFGNKQFFKDIPLQENRYVPPPMPALMARGLMPLMKSMGVVEERDGQLLMSEKDAYALTQAIPLLGQFRRLFPSEDKYQKRALTSWLSFAGIGMRSNTLDEQQSVLVGNDIQVKVSDSYQKSRDRQLQRAADMLNGKTE